MIRESTTEGERQVNRNLKFYNMNAIINVGYLNHNQTMSEVQKISIRFFDDREVRAVWDEEGAKWWFSVLDIVGVLNAQDDYAKNRNYWKYLKTKLRNEGNEVVSGTNQLKLLAPDGKRRLTDVLDNAGVIALAKSFPNNKASRFIE